MGRNLFFEKRFSPYPSSKSLDEEYEKKGLQIERSLLKNKCFYLIKS